MSELCYKAEGVRRDMEMVFRSHPVHVSLRICLRFGCVEMHHRKWHSHHDDFISSQEKLLAITGKPDPAAVENMLSKQLVSYGAWWWYVQPTVIWARSRNFIFDVFIKCVIVCLSVCVSILTIPLDQMGFFSSFL